jgi:hypothetical protein
MTTNLKEKMSNAIVRDCLLRNIQELNGDDESVFSMPDYANQMKIIIALHGIGEVKCARKACIDMYKSILELRTEYVNWFIECIAQLKFTPSSSIEDDYDAEEFNKLLYNIQRCNMEVYIDGITKPQYNEEHKAVVVDVKYCAAEFKNHRHPFYFYCTINYTDMLQFVSAIEDESINNYIEDGDHREKVTTFKYDVYSIMDHSIASIYLNKGGKTIIKEIF